MPLAIDGSAHASLNSSSISADLTTSGPGVVVCVVETNGGPITSVSGGGLTWTLHASAGTTSASVIELWYAVSASALTAETITATPTSSAFLSMTVFGVSGADTSNIFDDNASVPNTGTNAPRTISTDLADTMIIGAFRMANQNNSAGIGFTPITTTNYLLLQYQIVSAPQTSLSVPTGAGATSNGAIATAIRIAGAPSGPAITNIDGDNTLFEGQTSVQVNYTGGDASGNVVTVSPTNNIADPNAVTPAIASESGTLITLSGAFAFPTGVDEGGTAYFFVTSTGGTSASQAVARLDITNPSYSVAPAVASVTVNSVTISATATDTVSATLDHYAILLADGATAPSDAAQAAAWFAAGVGSNGVLAVGSDLAVTSGAAASITLGGALDPATAFDIYAFVEDESGNLLLGAPVNATTAALPTITTPTALKNKIGTVLASLTNVTVNVYNTSTGALVVRKASQTTNGSGILTFSDAAMSSATEYVIHFEYDTGGGTMADGVARITAT